MNRTKLTSFKVQSLKLKAQSKSFQLSAFSFILILFLVLTLALTLEYAFADPRGRPDHMSEEIVKTKEVVPVPQDIQVPHTVRRITDGSSMDYYPQFSPDGKHIVFVSRTDMTKRVKRGESWYKPYSLNLWIMESDGSNRRQLTSGDAWDFAPRFTYDGKKILFVSNREGKKDIWSINIDGTDIKKITDVLDWAHYPYPTSDGNSFALSIFRNLHGSIWLTDIDSKEMKRITSGGYGDDNPSFSPDNEMIAFKSMRQGNGDIWTIDKSGNYMRLTYDDSRELYPSWSPDGSKIAYVSDKGGEFDIWIMDKDGSNKKRLTKYLSNSKWGSIFDFNYDYLMGLDFYHISWHPDGKRLALTTWDEGKKGAYLTMLDFGKDIDRVMDSLPEEKETLPEYTLIGEKEITGGGNWDDFGPSFSPDGKIIAFASNRKGNWDIWTIGAEGEGLKQITKGSTDELASVFSPDGKEIAFLKGSKLNAQSSKELLSAFSFELSTYDIWIMKSDGSNARQVTKDISVISYPAWHPDGKEIAFIVKGITGPEIHIYDLSTGGEQTLFIPWDSKKSNSIMSSFTEENKLTPENMAQIKKLYPWMFSKKDMNPYFRGETEHIPYPLTEFIYRVDYDSRGDKITFESNLLGNIDIWTINRDGSEATRITKGDGIYLNPVFSPDGKKIIYTRKKFEITSYNQVSYNIWLADAQSGEEQMINGEEQTDWNPVFSPDGKRIAYVTNRSGEFKHYNIWMMYLK